MNLSIFLTILPCRVLLIFLTISGILLNQRAVADVELTEQALEILEKKCRECHHPDTEDEFPYLHKEIDFSELMEDDGGLVAGHPEESGIYTRVIKEATSSKRMPKSKGAPGDEKWKEPLSDQEKVILKHWIIALKKTQHDKSEESAPVKKEEDKHPKSETLAAAQISQDEVPQHADLETQARFIFTKRCLECHNPDDVSSLDFSLPLSEMVKKDAPDKNSVAEEIMSRINLPAGSDSKMPDPPAEQLPESEVHILKNWFESGADTRVKREPVYYTEMLRTIYQDLRDAEGTGKYYRYLTLTNLHNVSDDDGYAIHSDKEMDTFRAAISKLINSLSMNARVTTPTAIDAAETIYRIDLRDYKWKAHDWERVVGYYPHGILGVDARSEKYIYDETGSRMAYLRADWFTFAASQPPLYDDILDNLLGIYADDHHGAQQRLEKRLGVDRVHNLQHGEAIRAGFFDSGVSDHNRLIERHESDYGFYWVSYDFKYRASGHKQDLRKSPLGPVEAYLTDDPNLVFDHDGGEMIYSLPNGMQAYLLATADGTRLDRAPIDIVRTKKGDGSIINGISCINCHDQGMKPAIKVDPMLSGMEDQVAEFVEKSNILGGRELGLFRKLYPGKSKLQHALMLDYERFREANEVATMGIESPGEPITKLYESYSLTRVNSHRLAAEFGIEQAEMMELLEEESFSTDGFRTIYTALENGDAEPRQLILHQYLQIAYVLKYHLLPFVPLGYEEFGGAEFAKQIQMDPFFIALIGSPDYSMKKKWDDLAYEAKGSKEVLHKAHAVSKSWSRNSVILPHGGKLTTSVNAEVEIGKHGELSIWSDRDLYLQILLFSADGKVVQFFPNKANPDNLVPFSKWKEQNFKIPFTATANWDGSIGTEYFKVYASEAPLSISAKGQHVNGFQEFERSQIFSHRGATAMKAGFSKKSPSHTTTKTMPIKKNHRVYESRVGFLLKKMH